MSGNILSNNQNSSNGETPWDILRADETEEKVDAGKLVETDKEDTYRFEGQLTPENIEEINSLKNKTTIILENTAGLSSEILSQIDTDRVFFSVKGGLDYEKIKKYDASNYKERTMMSPKGLERAVKYFEKVEEGMDANWTDAQKCMYAYGCLAEDINYGEDKDDLLSRGTAARGLNGILYGELVCAGFAFAFQEMMNRSGIECHYQNQKDTHAYNVVNLDGKYYGVDVTWDSTHRRDEQCEFQNFGQDEHFYEKYGHQNYHEEEPDNIDDWERGIMKRVYDEEEERFELSTFSADELKENYKIIAPQFENRKKGAYRNFAEQPEEIKEKYLPIDTVAKALTREANQEYADFIDIYQFLKKEEALDIDPTLSDALQTRVGYVLDIRDHDYRHSEPNFGKEEKEQYVHINTRAMRGQSQENDQELKKNLANSLNTQLIPAIDGYLEKTYNSISEDIDAYEYAPDEMDANRRVEEGNHRTKMFLILGAKERLIALGHDKDEVEGTCKKIQEKYDATHQEEEGPSKKEFGLDFLGGVFADKQTVRKDIEEVEGRPLSDDEFNQKSRDADYLLNTVYPNLDLDEYGLEKQDFQKLLDGEIAN